MLESRQQPGSRRQLDIGVWLLTLYLGSAPVYWIPGVPLQLITALKFGLVGVSTVLIWGGAFVRERRFFPAGILGVWGLAMFVVAAAPGFFQAKTIGVVVDNGVDLILGFIVLWTVFIVVYNGVLGGGELVQRSAIIMAAFAILPFTSWLIGTPDFTNPWGFPLWFGGFGARRTGWSVALSLYVPVLVAVPLFRLGRGFWGALLSILLPTVVVGSQFASGGRAGLLASLLTVGLIVFLLLRRRYALLVLAIMIVGAVILAEQFSEHLRLDRLSGTDFQTMNSFSAGRLDAFRYAMNMFSARPLTGYGFDVGQAVMASRFGYTMEIHNVWLRLLVDAGLFLPMMLMLVVLRLAKDVVRSVPRGVLAAVRRHEMIINSRVQEDIVLVAAAGTVIAGLFVSQFEPNALIGSFQNEVFWWASCGVLAGIAQRRADERISSFMSGPTVETAPSDTATILAD